MTKTLLPVSFFFGANNHSGYCSLFGELYNPYEKGTHLILKGGPGTGKSTLIRKIADKLENKGYYVEKGNCGADPDSLDVVLAPEINFSVFDGTSPHTFDPVLPGVSEHIIELGVAWDREYLQEHIDQIGELTKLNKSQHRKTSDFLKVAAQLETHNAIMCSEFIDKEKTERYARRLANRIIPSGYSNLKGKKHKRFLSSITPEGIFVHHESIVALAETIFTIEDEFGAVSPFIMNYICEYALENGYDVYACYCPLFPRFKMEHIIIPALKTAIFTENSYHCSIEETSTRIHASRFFDKNALTLSKEKLTFYKKAKKELIDEAVRKVALAKDSHDRLEEYYVKATDFDVINHISEEILRKI